MIRACTRLGKYVSVRDPLVVLPRNRPMIISPEKLAILTNRDLSIFIQDTASIESLRAIGLENLVACIESRKNFLTSKELFRMVLGFCRTDTFPNKRLLNCLLGGITHPDKVKQFLAHELALMSVEMAACHRRAGPNSQESITTILAAFTDEFKRKIEAASPTDLTFMSTALCDMGLRDDECMSLIAQYATIQVSMFKGPDLADLLLAFAVAGFRSQEFLRSAFPHLTTRLSLLHDVQLLQVAFTACRFLPDIPEDIQQRFHKKYLSVVNAENRTFLDIPFNTWKDFGSSLDRLNVNKEEIPKVWSQFKTFSSPS